MKNVITKYPFILYVILIFSFSFLYTSSCSDNPNDPNKDFDLPDSNLTYMNDIWQFFTVKCGSENGCHSTFGGGLPARGLDLTNYQSIMSHRIDGSELLVIPTQGEQSFLYNILRNPISGRRQMPPDRTPLNPKNINSIKVWIDEGALP
jgi:hypothetical protein